MKTNSISAGLADHARTITTTRQLIIRRACLWTGFLAFATNAFAPQPAQAAVTEAWVHLFSNVLSNVTDQAVKVVRDAAGDIIVTGSTAGGLPGQDLLTIKYSGADGSALWQQRYNGPANSDDQATALAVDGSGNVVVTGSSGDDYYTAKYAAADGTQLWEKRYSYGQATALAVDGSGNVVVTGSSNGDYYTAKYAAVNGALLWKRRYNGPANRQDVPNAVVVDFSGNVVVTGSSGDDYYTAKYAAADGTLLWEKRYSYGQATALAVDGSGNVVVTGSSHGTNSHSDYYTAKYAAANGALLWEKRYNGPANRDDFANAVAVDGSGNVVVTGRSNEDYYTAKYAAADGALLWEHRYNGPANRYDSAYAVAVDGSGDVVVTGRTDASAGLGIIGGDYYTAKYAAVDGALLWEQRYIGSAPNNAAAQAVAVDGSGNVVVTGVAYNWGGFQISDGDYYTAKYAAVNGALLWEKRYNGPANSEDVPNAVVVDFSGNVVVTGSSGYDYYTAKYAAADGALLWEKRNNGPANGADIANAVAVDFSGNVVVTGYSYGTNSNDHYYTAKYAAADGALLWEKRNNGGGTAVALDGSGNVVDTGYSGTNSYEDFYTAKYAAADGALLWERRYSGPANSYDHANAVAVDGAGNVVVTGSSGQAAFPDYNLDYYTAKYAAADGALLWEKRYNGPGTFSADIPHAVAVDFSGNVVVTGDSYGTNSNDNFYTAKYAAADGALLWEKRNNGGGRAVAMDGSGNVVVTGYSGNDSYTAKYAAADGTLLWEKRFTGPASVGGSSHCLALGSDGMVAVTGTFNDGYATVVYREVPTFSIDLVLTGVRLRFTGVPGRSYNIERAPAVTGPWSAINTQTAPAFGLLEYLDTLPYPGSGFYRIVQP